jgi:serine/threonine-protein kinase PknK
MPPEIPGYEGLTEIGHGGFAVVYRAQDHQFNRSVAIKVLTGPLDAPARKRFERERRAMGALSRHPHCVTVYDSGFTADDRPYLVMEDMSGGSLRQRIKDGPMPWSEVVAIGVKLAGALHAAHEAGVLHRDIKPENVLCSAYGEPKIADFGIARLEEDTLTSGMIFATPAHSAPELFDGTGPTRASDVYSLGSTLFTLMAGSAPFTRRNDEPAIAIVTRASQEPVPDLRPRGVPDAVFAVVEDAMAKQPDDRPSAMEVGRRLRDAQQAAGVEQTPMAVLAGAIPAAVALADAPAIAEERAAAGVLPRTPELGLPVVAPQPSREPPPSVAEPDRLPEPTPQVVAPEPSAERAPPVAEPEPSPKPGLSPQSREQPPTERERRVAAAPAPRRTRAGTARRPERVRLVVAAVGAVALAALVIAVALTRGDRSGDGGGDAASPTTAASRSVATTAPAAPPTTDAPAPAAPPQTAPQAIEVGEAPTGLALGDGSVWVGNFGDGVVSRVDPQRNTVAATIPLGGRVAELAASDSGIWVTNFAEGTVSRVDPATNSVASTAKVGGDPIGVAGDGQDAWVASSRDGTISRVTPGGQLASRTRLGGTPLGVAVGERAVWVTNRADGTLSRIEPATGQMVARIPIGGRPLGVAVGEGSVWVTNEGDNTVSRVDPNTNAVVATTQVGRRPFRVATGAGAVWVTNRDDGTVSRIDPATGATGTFGEVGAGPSRVMVAEGSVWVTDEDGRAVFRLDASR